MSQEVSKPAPRFRVVITDCDFPPPHPEDEILAQAGAAVVHAQCHTEDEVIAAARDADGLLVQYAPVTARVIEQLTRCRAMARYGVGVDTIDVAAATRRGILVSNVPDYCIAEVSDHAVALLLACARRLFPLNAAVRRGVWDLKGTVSRIDALQDQTLGLVGFGRLARAVGSKARVFGLRVIAYDPLLPDAVFVANGVERVDFAQLLRESAFVSIHVPLTPQTHHLFRAETLALMKPGAYLINTARGPIVDEEALAAALRGGTLGGAALDVLDVEPPDPANPLLGLDNVILTPHAAFYSERSFLELRRRTADAVARMLLGEVLPSVLNPEAGQAAISSR